MSAAPPRLQPNRNRGPLSSDRLFHTTSPIITKDIQAFLSLCMLNWEQYTVDEQRGIISTLPPRYRVFEKDETGSLKCPLSAEFVASDRTIKDNVAQFQRDVSEGYYTKTWQEKAKKASQERAEGKFDEFLRSHAEEMFDENGKTQDDINADEASDGEFPGVKRRDRKKDRRSKARSKPKRDRTRRLPEAMEVDEFDGG